MQIFKTKPLFFIAALFGLSVPLLVFAGTLSCSVAASCPLGAIAYRMSSTSNAHAELGTQSNYPDMVCCTGVTGLTNSCSGTFAMLLKLSSTTNAHAEKNTFSNYANNACLAVPSGGSINIGYQTSNCNGYDTTVGSIESDTNSHVGGPTAYVNKICATAVTTPSLTFSISDNTIGFGSLLSVATRYATGDTLGSSTDAIDAHTISAGTNALGGYYITVQGSTLASGADSITPIGPTASTSSTGTKQFGLRLVLNSGTGSVSTPYNTSGWALDTAAFPDTIATGLSDGTTSIFGLRYVANINASTPAGSYSSVLTYVVTSGF